MIIEYIGTPPELPNGQIVPITPAIRAGSLVFVSGQLGVDDSGKIIAPDIESQTRQCLARIEKILEQAGSSLGQVVKVCVWLINKEDFGPFNAVYRERFTQHLPARSTVVSELLIPGARIEMDAIAVTQ